MFLVDKHTPITYKPTPVPSVAFHDQNADSDISV